MSGLHARVIGAPAEDASKFRETLEEAGYQVLVMAAPASENADPEPCHLIFLDPRAGFDLAETLTQTRLVCPEAAIVVLLQAGQLAQAVEAMKIGASACLTLPVSDERLRASAESFGHTVNLEAQVARLRLSLKRQKASESIVGQSRALLRCIELGKLVAGYPMNVLLNGESGSGKESMAALIHNSSGREAGPFVAVDCGTLAEELADDELFGHKKGAFTGAESDRVGRLQEASGGTLFLDEIGNLPLAQQAKLLRVLQAREIWPLGSAAAVAVDLRIVAATHEDLPALVKAGRFRLDLYHRLNEFSLRVPALRERPDDIEPLALYFIHQLCQRFGREALALDPRALQPMQRHPWPGNIRQLQNALKHACILAKGSIKAEDLPPEILAEQTAPASMEAPQDGLLFSEPAGLLTLWQAADRVTEEVERRMISEALVLNRGDSAAAAKGLDLHPKTLARKVRSYGLMGLLGG
jgi:two-component system NtrC family response regulator